MSVNPPSTRRNHRQNSAWRRPGSGRHDTPRSLPISGIVCGAAAVAYAPVGAYTGSVLTGVLTAVATTAAVALAALMIRA
ncbi:hypothetical protein [Rhodococcus rhodochrous]|uniref:Uncharacterized protein n=1 Tax=Rhodococcus rhodochrous KG-21 TaxID=1441923 RepID=A0A0M8PFD7_RHORH|nr:hypothetical protein [Rhodococcus rhodochrous]KOS55236.1 hypothetical protein Z051_16110 [Rhodococcus rhodochrous KG-21]